MRHLRRRPADLEQRDEQRKVEHLIHAREPVEKLEVRAEDERERGGNEHRAEEVPRLALPVRDVRELIREEPHRWRRRGVHNLAHKEKRPRICSREHLHLLEVQN
eukprot:Amastigsp_a342547_6.p3 type:complete len:105 gc:universal Amastigsp_a342547_6:1004-1318(+)